MLNRLICDSNCVEDVGKLYMSQCPFLYLLIRISRTNHWLQVPFRSVQRWRPRHYLCPSPPAMCLHRYDKNFRRPFGDPRTLQLLMIRTAPRNSFRLNSSIRSDLNSWILSNHLNSVSCLLGDFGIEFGLRGAVHVSA